MRLQPLPAGRRGPCKSRREPMCGIVGAVAERDVVPILMEGLRRLEYRGYDSAGLAVLNGSKHLTRLRTVGKVHMLDEALAQTPTAGHIGIAHTRWATHGVPSERNAHPHISRDGLAIVHNGIIERHGSTVERPVRESELSAQAAERGPYRHFMLKEIHEQPRAIANTLQERVANGRLLEAAFGPAATEVFRRTRNVHIVACGTSFHAACCARYFIEQVCKVPCSVDIASEYRYRNPLVPANSLFVSISQSGETADTLAALRLARQSGYLSSLAVCNVPESSLVRESELVMLTRAGPEIGVASTKAFTTQLAALGMLVIALARHGSADAERERGLITRLIELPGLVEKTLELDAVIARLAERFELERLLHQPRQLDQ